MKNNIHKFRCFVLYFVIFMMHFLNIVTAQEIKFESKILETFDNEKIIASGDVKVFDDMYILNSDRLEIDKKRNFHILSGNVFLEDKEKNKIFSNKILIDIANEEYISQGETELIVNNLYNIKTKNLIYNKSKKIINSNKPTIIIDEFNNKINLNNFIFNVKDKILKADNVTIVDKEKNIYEIEKIIYNFNQKKIYGKDVIINRDNINLQDKKYLARSKSRSVIIDKNETILSKTVYTNCNKRDGCPQWLILADNVTHDKIEKTITYDNATLKIFNFPVFYFPKFFHPDNTVKRKSGFLIPSLKNNKSKTYVNTPYYFAISEESDFTFSPRIYENSDFLYQGEYRKEMKNSSHIIDAGVFGNDFSSTSKNSSKTHLFLKSKLTTALSYFEESYLDIDIQLTSNDNYLKALDVKSPIIESQSLLGSNFKFNASKDDMDFTISTEIYEDLTKEKTSDKYEYILPNFSLTKNLNSKLDGNLEFLTSGYSRMYETNVNEKKLINNLNYSANVNYNNLGILSNYEILLKNVNSDAKNSSITKNKIESNLQGIFQYNVKLPMQKKNKKTTKILTPKLTAKYNPMKNKNISQSDRLVDFNNIFSIDRIGSNEILEGGQSLTIGAEYKIFNNDDLNNQKFGLNLATSIRPDENNDLPIKSSLNKKTSNFVGNANFKVNDFVNLDYDFITKNNLREFNYHKIKSSFKINNFVTKFEFIEENNQIGDESFLTNETSLEINKNNSLLFKTRENKKTNLKEYYDLIYQYKMDCLVANIEYGKKYYNDGNLKPEESIMFSITFMPFDNTVNFPNID